MAGGYCPQSRSRRRRRDLHPRCSLRPDGTRNTSRKTRLGGSPALSTCGYAFPLSGSACPRGKRITLNQLLVCSRLCSAVFRVPRVPGPQISVFRCSEPTGDHVTRSASSVLELRTLVLPNSLVSATAQRALVLFSMRLAFPACALEHASTCTVDMNRLW